MTAPAALSADTVRPTGRCGFTSLIPATVLTRFGYTSHEHAHQQGACARLYAATRRQEDTTACPPAPAPQTAGT